MSRTIRLLLLLPSAALLFAGCAAHKPPVTALYAGLKEKPETLDATALAGRRIVIDPGHGGAIGGAVGVDSLREADANLGVALYLWGLCKDAGAQVELTRSSDRDYLPPGSKSSGDDLKARIEKANEIDTDVFISIHHNSNLALRRDMNRIEVYYRSDDPGASLELASDVETHLSRNLGIERSEVRPGNYYVLRLSKARAAVLGEASYLSQPDVENRLKLSEKQKLEAQAYYLGLIAYFSRGVPALERLSPAADTLTSPAVISFRVLPSRGMPIDPASVGVSIGQVEAASVYDPVTRVMRLAMDPRLPNGTYAVWATARSVGGATARTRPYALFLDRPARHILPLEPERGADSTVSLSVRVLDELGSPVADGTPVTAHVLKKGATFSGRTIRGVFTVEAPLGFARYPFAFKTRGTADTMRFAVAAAGPSLGVLVTDTRTGSPVPGAIIVRSGGAIVTGDDEGRALVPLTGRPDTLIVRATGYAPAIVDGIAAGGASTVRRVALEPFFGGALIGKRIVLDPGGGGSDPDGVGANRLRGSSVSLEVAKQLRGMLEAAGARIDLTRDGDETISVQERVYLVNRSGAELAIGIHHGPVPGDPSSARTIFRYPGSAPGMLVSRSIGDALQSVPPAGAFALRETADAFVTHTSCPAVELYCGSVETPELEALMASPQWTRLEAERLCAGIAASFGAAEPPPGTARVKALAGGAPAAGAEIDLDGVFVQTADEQGAALFSCVAAGRHLVTVRTRDGRAARFMTDLAGSRAGEVILELR